MLPDWSQGRRKRWDAGACHDGSQLGRTGCNPDDIVAMRGEMLQAIQGFIADAEARQNAMAPEATEP